MLNAKEARRLQEEAKANKVQAELDAIDVLVQENISDGALKRDGQLLKDTETALVDLGFRVVNGSRYWWMKPKFEIKWG